MSIPVIERPCQFSERLFVVYTQFAYTKSMKSIFVESSIFEKHRSEYLSDDDYRRFQYALLAEPNKGDVIQDSGGLRKVRVAAKGKGKRGGARVIYYHFDQYNRFYLLTIYAKNEISDLTCAQKKQLKDFMEVWKHEQT